MPTELPPNGSWPRPPSGKVPPPDGSAQAADRPNGWAAAGSDRLTGWKDIANYLGKGVRTAQRWERQFGLPVQRIGGEAVFALRSEIDAWSTSKSGQRGQNGGIELPADVNGDTDDQEKLPSRLAARLAAVVLRRPHISALVMAVTAVAVTVAVVAAVVSLRRAGAPPGPIVSTRTSGNELHAIDAQDRVVWSKPFDEPQRLLHDEGTLSRIRIVTDLTGDGKPEVLYIARGDRTGPRLFVFNSDGTIRFERQWRGTVRFGGRPHHGPFRAQWMWVTREADGRPVIWLSSRHMVEFPSVLERLDASGTVTGEYWHGGEIMAFAAGRVGSRNLILAGGPANEGHGASLAIFDADNFGGTAPGPDAEHTCNTCPPGRPLRFYIFPRDELGELIRAESDVRGMTLQADGGFTVTVRHRDLPESQSPTGRPIFAFTDYWFGSDLAPERAEYVDQYRIVHDELFKRELVDHDFAGHDKSLLFPIKEWRDDRFVEVWPEGWDKGTRAQNRGASRQ